MKHHVRDSFSCGYLWENNRGRTTKPDESNAVASDRPGTPRGAKSSGRGVVSVRAENRTPLTVVVAAPDEEAAC